MPILQVIYGWVTKSLIKPSKEFTYLDVMSAMIQ